MPRSLNFCCTKLQANLEYLTSDYGEESESHRLAQTLTERFMTQDIDVIFDYGLHEYIQNVLSSLSGLSKQIEIDFRFYE